jgi:hypothetical protein
MTSLVSGIINDVRELIKQEVAMLRHEIKEDFRKTKEATLAMGVGITVAALGGFLLCFLLVYLLYWAIPGLALWGAFGIVGGFFIIVGGVLTYLGKKKFDSFNPLPDESAQALKENVEWITKPK